MKKSSLGSTSQAPPGLALPDFLVIGAMKAGTTSLMQNLLRHRQIRMPSREVHFFDKNFDKGLEWYAAFFEGHEHKVCGEKTPGYITKAAYMERAASIVPDAKIVVLLREPVARLLSQINHRIQKGRLPQPEVIDMDFLRSNILSTPARERDYLGRSRYAEQLRENVLPYFPMERVFARATDRFSAQVRPENLDRVTEGNEDKRRGTERSEATRALLHELQDFLGVERRDPGSYRVVGVRSYSARANDEVRGFLHEHFREHNERLFDLLGYRIEEWTEATP